MRRVIRKQVRRSEGGVNIAADLDAALAINTGEDAKVTRTVVRSSRSVVQGAPGKRDRPGEPPSDSSGPSKENA